MSLNAEDFAASLGLSVQDVAPEGSDTTFFAAPHPAELLGVSDEENDSDAAPSPAPQPTATRKRGRSGTKKTKAAATPTAAPTATGLGVVVIGDRFVCSYSGRVVDHAVFIPGVDTACFANLPCAFAWLEDESNVSAETQDKLKSAMAAEYEQTLENVVRAPKRNLLVDFGGDRYYSEWIGPLAFWDRHTEAQGSTVDEWKKRGNQTAARRGKGAAARVAFDAAAYVIAYGKGAAGCKKVNTVDGAAIAKGTKNVLTIVKAYRKLQTFINGHVSEEEDARQLYEIRQLSSTNGWYASVIVPHEGVVPEDKLRNNIASQVVGFNVYGPAVVVFTRKHSQKI
jgi:hypothetical protein